MRLPASVVSAYSVRKMFEILVDDLVVVCEWIGALRVELVFFQGTIGPRGQMFLSLALGEARDGVDVLLDDCVLAGDRAAAKLRGNDDLAVVFAQHTGPSSVVLFLSLRMT